MIDQNAFGLLISYFTLEDDEYCGEREDFVQRYCEFAECIVTELTQRPPALGARAIDLGFALYVEFEDGDQHGDPIAWLRQLRATLASADYATAAFLTHGSVWIDEAEPRPDILDCGGLKLVRACRSSEPLRRALWGEAATHQDEASSTFGWGPGYTSMWKPWKPWVNAPRTRPPYCLPEAWSSSAPEVDA
jgi:hypothetical protein